MPLLPLLLWLQVEVMQRELQELQPVLAATAKEVEDMMVVIAHDKEEAAETKKMVQQQEREANEQAAAAKAIAGGSSHTRVPHVSLLHTVCMTTADYNTFC
jgi:2',3'-cyclic-nucleotide 2'-phosphodiesterase (5'-nucleotidase family)